MAFESIDTTLQHTIGELIKKACGTTPDEVAVVYNGTRLTYGELDRRSDNFAGQLNSEYPDTPIIGVSTNRSIEMIVQVVGILKAGRFYLPLDKTYPETRLRQIITDAQTPIVACTTDESDFFSALGLSTISANDNSDQPSTFDSSGKKGAAGYILYTSGSTGVPKGVQMGERALVNLLEWQRENSDATTGTKTLQFAPLTFDVSFQEIFSTLTTGGTLYLVDDDLRLNPQALLEFIQTKGINRLFLPFVALQMLTDTANFLSLFPTSIREIMTAGEQLKITPQVRQFFTQIPGAKLYNQYGPTEAHVVSALTLEGTPDQWPELPSIGFPIHNVGLFILNDQLELVHDQAGELYIGGICLAEGYLNKPDLTAERFFEWQHPEKGNVRLYRSGDLAKYLPNGEIEFLGRIDHQVKIRGHRVELGEIEALLSQQPSVKDAVVTAVGKDTQDRKLVAYILVDSPADTDLVILQRALRGKLPDYMVPTAIVPLDVFPKTSSGKVDRKSLPAPVFKRPELDVLFAEPKTKLQKQLAGVWIDLLNIDRVGIDDNFFELGGNSLLAQKCIVMLKRQHQIDLPITKLYQYGTVAGIAGYLSDNGQTPLIKRAFAGHKNKGKEDPIAVVGFAGRFPGARNVEEFWKVLLEGKETTKFFSTEELDPSIPEDERNDDSYVRARGIIDNAESFDERVFGLSPVAADIMDPQQRIFLEICRDVLETSGHLPEVYDGVVGVYAGSGHNSYYQNNVLAHPDIIRKIGSFQALSLNEKDYIASRVAYQLNLKGPAVSVFSACSTSLLAIAQAVDGLKNGQCDVALAGGAAIKSPVNSGHIYEEGAMFSDDGHCRPFDADAKGTVFSDGAGVILLKRLSDAEKAGDHIYAVIKGIGISNDGGGKGSFTAPSPAGQATSIAMALADADIDPATVSYIETHGTATPLGDPIEIEGLQMAFGQQEQKQYCRIGSVKSNMGHLTHAAGAAGFIKTALSLHHKVIPPSINYRSPNPAIDFDNSPFVVNDQLTEWKSDTPRRAGISSFGVGGTNVHIILEEYLGDTAEPVPLPPASVDTPFLISWSAATESAASAYAGLLAAYLEKQPTVPLCDIAYTLHTTRQSFRYRNYIVAANTSGLIEQLTTGDWKQHKLTQSNNDVIFMFPGQGAQYPDMGKDLYDRFPAYKDTVDRCADLLMGVMEEDIRDVIFADDPERLRNTRYTQPAIFVTEYALATLWISWGIQPAAFVGHSVGEFVGACLAGVFSLSDALTLVAMRGRLISELPSGSMASIRESVDLIRTSLPEGLSLAANNAPKLCVVAGPTDLVQAYIENLDRQGIKCNFLHTSHAFHSSAMDPILGAFEDVVRRIPKQVPQKPVISTVSGTWLSDEEARNDRYWVRHVRETVNFSDAISFARKELNGVFLEVGPGRVTATLTRQHPDIPSSQVISGIHTTDTNDEITSLYDALGRLWTTGIAADWKMIYGTDRQLVRDLPNYAYDRNRHWLAPKQAEHSKTPTVHLQDLTTSKTITPTAMRKSQLITKIKEILDNASGITIEDDNVRDNFIEIGFDSLLLTQVAQTLKKEFNLPITFRKLNEEYYNLDLLADYLDQNLPKEQFALQQETVVTPAPVIQPAPQQIQQLAPQYMQQPAVAMPQLSGSQALPVNQDSIALISQQLNLMAQQIALLQGAGAPVTQPASQVDTVQAHASTQPVHTEQPQSPSPSTTNDLSQEELAELKKPFGATARIERKSGELTEKQRAYLEQLKVDYVAKTAKSKAYTQEHRAYMADPRVVSGFKPLTKELTYSLVVNRSAGSRLWDIDGNEYVDALNGFGSNMLGNQPQVIKEALLQQIEEGYEIGPQHEKAGAVCKLVKEFTGMDRVGLCNTGSEAVLGAMRIARTVTGRSTIVAFTGSYHGIVDEVIIRGTKKLKSFPGAPGILPEAVQNMLILDYGTEESLRIIRERADELAAVLVEPIQSRRPEFRPVEFLKEVRKITEASGTALIFDEVISGFRFHPRGAQGLFGITADIGTYGKVAGAGISIGIIAGKKHWMDALDGGFWQYGDDSIPEAGVTYFAGTFVRHPLALATTKAALEYMKAQGPQLQEQLNRNTDYLAGKMNATAERYGTPIFIAHFGSLWKIKYKEEYPYSELLFTSMRHKGIHIQDGFPCFLTTAHTQEDIDAIADAFEESVKELVEAGFIPTAVNITPTSTTNGDSDGMSDNPPYPGARLGLDGEGNPAWFVEDSNNPGQFLQVTSQ